MPEPVGEPIEHRAIVYHSPEGYQPLALDVFLPPESVPRPVPVLLGFHGGAFHSGNRGQYHGFARELARRGYAMVTPSYRLYGTALWPACVDDAVAAVGWVREHADEYGFDPARVGAMGRSAGAYLALMLATTQGADGKPLVRAAISEAGPTDLTPELWDGTMQGAFLAGFFGQHPREETSPAWRVADWPPPLLVFHGCQDTTVPFTQSYVLDIRMKSAGREMRLVPMPGTGHDPLSRNTAQGMREVFAFLDEHMK
ncbi:MAG: alpha/beta hydrolase [Planctomycetota bacterium]